MVALKMQRKLQMWEKLRVKINLGREIINIGEVLVWDKDLMKN